MSNFEKITASLETLGDFLASLMAVDTPWEDAFHKTFCTECGRDNCDEKRCPFQKERDNPTWWLFQTAEGEQEAANDSEREFLIREYERRLARLKNGASPCGVIFRNGRAELEPETVVPLQDEERHGNGICNEFDVIDQKLIVVRTGYEKVLNGFLAEMQAQRREKVEKTGIEGFTEFEALMPELIRFILPDRKCRIVLEYDPEASSVELRREVTEAEQV